MSLFHHELVNRLFHNENFTSIQLLEYDQNIFRHTQQISTRRIEPIRWKYFQYLALLFTEVYLDKYFSDKLGLMAELNAYLENEFNNDAATFHEITPFTENDLNKIAFWNATGSGKTLLTQLLLRISSLLTCKIQCRKSKSGYFAHAKRRLVSPTFTGTPTIRYGG
ncbi:hypothetical protein JZU68_10475 [bacterium]|nr:hypothetical protein [bacterium]